MSKQTNAPTEPSSGQPHVTNQRRIYAVIFVLVAIIVVMLGAVMYGANRLAFRQQLIGTWSSPEQSGQTEPPAITVEFFDNGTYRWATAEASSAAMIHRGYYTIEGSSKVRLAVHESANQNTSTPAVVTFTAQVIADQLVLSNEQQVITLFNTGE